MSQEDQLAKAEERTNKMIAFHDKARKTYWKKVTEWEPERCKWEAAIAIKLAKQGRGVTLIHSGTNELLEDLVK